MRPARAAKRPASTPSRIARAIRAGSSAPARRCSLEELDGLNRHFREEAGTARGLPLQLCHNDRPDHVRLLTGLVLRNLRGWLEPAGGDKPASSP